MSRDVGGYSGEIGGGGLVRVWGSRCGHGSVTCLFTLEELWF